MSNIKPFGIAEPLDDYVNAQIKVRQQKKASGFGNEDRGPRELAYLVGQNAWIRCASATKIINNKRLSDMGFNEEQIKEFTGQGLAKNFVLFNGTTEDGKYTSQKGGYFDGVNKNPSYGIGDLDFGQVPMPGIISFDVSNLNNGALREATLIIEAQNRTQYNILETLYVRLGYTIFIEWGNNFYFDNSDDPRFIRNSIPSLIEDSTWFDQKGIDISSNTFLQFANKIEEQRKKAYGNYDAFVGRVTNYNVEFTTEGKYIITVNIVSSGNVVESIAINNLTPRNTIKKQGNPEQEKPSEDNKCDFKNYLVTSKSDEVYNTVNQSTGKIDYVNLSIAENIQEQINHPDLQYIRFGNLLDFIEGMQPHNNGVPLLTIDNASESYMNIFKNLISTNPSACIIKNTNLIETFDQDHNKMFQYFEPIENPEDETEGVIGNIYLRIDKLFDIFDSLNGDNNTEPIFIFDLVNGICRSINSCLGGYVELSPSIYRDNTLIIRDIKHVKPRKNAKDQEKIIVYGFNNDPETPSSSVVRGYNIKTEISGELASQLAIGAAANNQANSYINPFFDALNYGVQDIYQAGTVTDGNPESNSITSKAYNDKTTESNTKKVNTAIPATQTTEQTGESSSEVQTKRENKKTAEETKTEAKDLYFSYLNNMLSVHTYTPKHRYFQLKKDDFESGSKKLQSYINAIEVLVQKNFELENKPGGKTVNKFVPIVLNIQMDGLAGANIFNIIKVQTEFLPINYPDVIDFIVRGVSHRLQENDWVTTLDTLSIPRVESQSESQETAVFNEDSVEPEIVNKDNVIGDTESILEETPDVSFFPPLGQLPPFSIRGDGGGSGEYGARRTHGPHLGIDLPTVVPPSGDFNIFKEFPLLASNARNANYPNVQTGTVQNTLNLVTPLLTGLGTPVYAPITGKLRFAFAASNSVLPGLSIKGSGEYEGFSSKIFYVAPDKTRLGRVVKKGEFVGYAVDLSLQKNYANDGVTNHIHYAIYKGLRPLNPLKVNYSL